MVRFSPLLILLWIVAPFFIVANSAQGKNYRPKGILDHSLTESKNSGIMRRRKRSAPDIFSVVKFNMTGFNDTSVKFNGSRSSDVKAIVNEAKLNFVHNSHAISKGKETLEQLGESTNFSYAAADDFGQNATARGLTLMNFNGPVISQDVESLEDNGLINSSHIRVKRGAYDSDDGSERGKIDGGGFLGAEISHFKNDDKSNVRNELADMYPDLIDDPVKSSSAVELVRKKRLDYEMMLPGGPSSKEYAAEVSKNIENVENGGHLRESKDSEEREINRRHVASISGRNAFGNRNSKRRRKRDVLVRARRSEKAKRTKKGKKRKKGKGHGKTHKKKKKGKQPATDRDKRNGLYPNSVSKLNAEYGASNKRETSRLVDDLQVEAHVEKRDSGDARSEIDINKREISENDNPVLKKNETQAFRDKRTTDCLKNSPPDSGEQNFIVKQEGANQRERNNEQRTPIRNHADFRRARCGKEESRYYDDVHVRPNLQAQRDDIELKLNTFDKAGKRGAAKSVEQIKELMVELIDRVDELETYVGSADNDQERKRGKKRTEEGDLSNLDLKDTAKENGSRVCADEIDASRSKLDVQTRGRAGEGKEQTGQSSKEMKRSTGMLKGHRKDSKRGAKRRKKSHRKWDKWTDWSSCSVTCGKGRQIRWRHCIYECTTAETEMEEKACQLPACGPGKFLGIF